MYTCELVHPSLRGVAAAIYAVSQALGYSLILLLGAVTPTWRYAIGAVGALTIPTFILLVAIVPESPAWLLRVDREEEAESSLRKWDDAMFGKLLHWHEQLGPKLLTFSAWVRQISIECFPSIELLQTIKKSVGATCYQTWVKYFRPFLKECQ